MRAVLLLLLVARAGGVVVDVALNLTGALPLNASTYAETLALGGMLSVSASAQTVSAARCPAGFYCPASATAPVPCPAGTYLSWTGAQTAASCNMCYAGSYGAGAGHTACVVCPAGTYQPVRGQVGCLMCPPGTFSASTGAAGACPLCPANRYCPSATADPACPPYTVSTQGQSNQFGCTCVAGYFCTYSELLSISIALNDVNATDFALDVGGVRTAFVESVAAAAGVLPSAISIAGTQQGRRMLSIEASVHGALRHEDLHLHLVARNLTAARLRTRASQKPAF